MKYHVRIEKAITAVRKDLNVKGETYVPLQTERYWNSVQTRSEEFNVSGGKVDMIIQAQNK